MHNLNKRFDIEATPFCKQFSQVAGRIEPFQRVLSIDVAELLEKQLKIAQAQVEFVFQKLETVDPANVAQSVHAREMIAGINELAKLGLKK